MLSALRDLVYRAQCAMTITPQAISDKQTKLTLTWSNISRIFGSRTSVGTHSFPFIVLSCELTSERVGADRTSWHHCSFLTSKFCSVKQDQDGQQGTFGKFFCRDKVKRSLESIFKTEVFNSKHSILLKPLCLIVGGGVVFWLVCLCTKYHLNYAFPNLDIASKATQTEGTAHSLLCLK